LLLRLAELSYLQDELEEPCVLLLDDLFSELDDDVGNKLKEMFRGPGQIFVTSPAPMQWESDRPVGRFRVIEGKVLAER
jgi:recombinational DNA repair ATPase RecF